MRFRLAITAPAVLVSWLQAAEPAWQDRVSIHFPKQTTVDAGVLTGALAEAARIWRPYGIVVNPDSSGDADKGPITALLVGLDVDHERGESLGEIRFAASG